MLKKMQIFYIGVIRSTAYVLVGGKKKDYRACMERSLGYLRRMEPILSNNDGRSEARGKDNEHRSPETLGQSEEVISEGEAHKSAMDAKELPTRITRSRGGQDNSDTRQWKTMNARQQWRELNRTSFLHAGSNGEDNQSAHEMNTRWWNLNVASAANATVPGCNLTPAHIFPISRSYEEAMQSGLVQELKQVIERDLRSFREHTLAVNMENQPHKRSLQLMRIILSRYG